MLVQEDKSSWTKIDVSTDKMLTKFITIKGEDVFAKQPYKDLKVSIYILHTNRISNFFSFRSPAETVCSLKRATPNCLLTTQSQTASSIAPGRWFYILILNIDVRKTKIGKQISFPSACLEKMTFSSSLMP